MLWGIYHVHVIWVTRKVIKYTASCESSLLIPLLFSGTLCGVESCLEVATRGQVYSIHEATRICIIRIKFPYHIIVDIIEIL